MLYSIDTEHIMPAAKKTTTAKKATPAKKTVAKKELTLSVVIPMYNEEDNVNPMVEAVEAALKGITFELIFVDDGSSDKTIENILAIKKPWLRLEQFARNFGQTSAMAAGIAAAEGKYIVTLDGDLQNDPSDIPLMIEKLEKENVDIVAGRRANRKDGMFLRKVPSVIANKLIRKISKTNIRDLGCTLKLFRREVAQDLDLYGELHRFIPILADIRGAKIVEMDVKHHSRQFGVSKYGLGRTFKVASDLMLMAFFIRYRQKPMHLFGTWGIACGTLGGLIEFYLLILKIMGEDIVDRPLFFVGFLLILVGIQLIGTGFIAEMQMRTYFGSQNKTPYTIAKRYKGGKEV
jgi:dolichol-phosphate mannosyltransferase